MNNLLHFYLDLLRLDNEKTQSDPHGVTALNNIIRTMRLVRRDRLCGEDFTRLDFGNIPLNHIYLYHCSFDSSRFSRWNFIGGHQSGITDVIWDPYGKYILTGSSDCTAILWDASSGLMLRKLTGHTNAITSMAFSTDGKHIITGSEDCTAIIWDKDMGTPIKPLEGHINKINSVAVSPDGCCITLDENNTLKKWDIQSRECLKTTFPDNSPRLFGKLSPCGRYCVSRTDKTVKLYQTDGWKMIKSFYDEKDHSITFTRFSPNSKYIISGCSDGVALVSDIDERRDILEVKAPGFRGSVTCAAVSPKGDTVFTGYANGSGIAWSIGGECLAELKEHNGSVTAATFSHDGSALCTGSNDCCAIIWDTSRWEKQTVLRGYFSYLTISEISADGRYCLTDLSDERVRVWDIENGRLTDIIDGNGEEIISVQSYPTGKYYMTRYNDKNCIHDLKNGECIRSFDCDTISALLPDGKHYMARTCDDEIGIYDIHTGDRKKALKIPHGRNYWTVAFHPDSSYCIFYGRYSAGEFIVYDLQNGKILGKPKYKETREIAFSDDGKYFTVVADGGIVSVWGVPKCRQIISYEFPSLNNARIIGNYLYGIKDSRETFSIFRMDITDFNNVGEPETLATFYNTDNLNIRGCSFRDITADDTAREIIYQYGGETDKS